MVPRNLYSHATRWTERQDQSTFRLASGPIVVTDPVVVESVLTGGYNLRDQSGFLRVQGNNPLPIELRKPIVTSLRHVLGNFQPPSPLTLFPDDNLSIKLRTWGALLLRRYFRDLLAKNRSAALDKMVDNFVRTSIIRDATRGRRVPTGFYHQIWRRASLDLSRYQPQSSCQDLVDIVLTSEVDPQDRGELYLRLVLSCVGFTSTALEWVILQMGRDNHPPSDARNVFLECQRRYPTAWRLLRELDGEQLFEGIRCEDQQAVVLSTHSVHNSSQHWNGPDRFDPARWDSVEPPASIYLPFGRGSGSCPGAGFATTTVISIAEALYESFTVRRIVTKGRPLVLTFAAPPRGTIQLRRRS